SLLREVDEVRDRRQEHRHLEALVDARVELDVHREGVLDAERVADRAADEQAAARDCEHDVGPVAVRVGELGRLAGAGTEVFPAHQLAGRVVHPAILTAAADSTSSASAMSSALESSRGEWLTPPFRLRTKSIPAGTPAAARMPASWPAPETSSGASGAAARSAGSGGGATAAGAGAGGGAGPHARGPPAHAARGGGGGRGGRVEREDPALGDDVHRSRLDAQLSDRRDGAVGGGRLRVEHELRRLDERVVAPVHRRRARVVGAALEDDLAAGLADD